MNNLMLAFSQKEMLEKNNEDKDLVVSNCGYFTITNKMNKVLTDDDNNDYLLIYLYKGSMSLSRTNDSQIIHENSFVLYEPNELRSYTFYASQPSEHYFVYFKGKNAKMYLQQFGILPKKQFSFIKVDDVITDFKNIIDDFKIHDFDNYIFRVRILLNIFQKIYTAKNYIFIDDRISSIRPAIRLMETSNQILSIKEYANSSFMSVPTFMRKFKKETGTTPLNYATDICINKAKSYLLHTSLSIAEISDSLGFCNPYYFSSFFKKKCGVSPSEFRNGD